jgi:hypothetical protein
MSVCVVTSVRIYTVCMNVGAEVPDEILLCVVPIMSLFFSISSAVCALVCVCAASLVGGLQMAQWIH